jgi:spermidine/putrescine transport system permease protein
MKHLPLQRVSTWRLVSRLVMLLILGASVVVVLSPLLAVLILSFSDESVFAGRWVSVPTLRWYFLLPREIDAEAWLNTVYLSVGVATIATLGGTLIALNWWNRTRVYMLLALGFGIAIVPTAAYSTALSHSLALVGVSHSSALILAIADVVSVLPFSALVVMLGVSRVSRTQLMAARELSQGRITVVAFRVIFPPAYGAIVSGFCLAFLLTANECVRSMYLGGSFELLGKVVFGKLSSGTDPTVYSITGLNLVVSSCLVVSSWYALIGRKERIAGEGNE